MSAVTPEPTNNKLVSWWLKPAYGPDDGTLTVELGFQLKLTKKLASIYGVIASGDHIQTRSVLPVVGEYPEQCSSTLTPVGLQGGE